MRKQTLLLFKSPNFLFCYGSPRKLKQSSIKDVVYKEKSQGGVEERKREGRKNREERKNETLNEGGDKTLASLFYLDSVTYSPCFSLDHQEYKLFL